MQILHSVSCEGKGDAGHDRMSILRWLLWLQYVVQSRSPVRRFVTPQTAAHQASLSFTLSQSMLKLMPIESVMPFNHLIVCRPLLFLSSVFPSIRVFFSELALHIWWLKISKQTSIKRKLILMHCYCLITRRSFSFSNFPKNDS